MNDQSILLTKDNRRETEERLIHQPISNNTPRRKYQTTKLKTIRRKQRQKPTIICWFSGKSFDDLYIRCSLKVLPNPNKKKITKQTFYEREITIHY